jgi:hypothetical protein
MSTALFMLEQGCGGALTDLFETLPAIPPLV